MRLRGKGHADALVLHRDARHITRRAVASPSALHHLHHFQADPDWALLRGVFERVGQVVGDHLGDSLGVGEYWHRLAAAWQLQQDSPVRLRRALLLDGHIDDGTQIARLHAEGEAALKDARVVYEVVGQPGTTTATL